MNEKKRTHRVEAVLKGATISVVALCVTLVICTEIFFREFFDRGGIWMSDAASLVENFEIYEKHFYTVSFYCLLASLAVGTVWGIYGLKKRVPIALPYLTISACCALAVIVEVVRIFFLALDYD